MTERDLGALVGFIAGSISGGVFMAVLLLALACRE
jgi:hypothetical protein